MCVFVRQQKGAMTVTKVVTVVKTKKGPHTHKKKGELMENDQDAMEVIFQRRSILNKSCDSLVYGRATQLVYNAQVSLVFWQYSSEEEEVDLQTALTGFRTKQRKVLEPVDHEKIQYESYRKNFYVEVPELAKMTQDGQ